MVLELGPSLATEAEAWTKFARRVIIELRSRPEIESVMSPDLLNLWSRYIDRWAEQAAKAIADGEAFRWSEQLEPEVGEFMLHGLDQCMHSSVLSQVATRAETNTHRDFTMNVVRAFVEGLSTEGQSCNHYVDQVLTSFATELAD